MKIQASSYSHERTMPYQESGLATSLPWHHQETLEELIYKDSSIEEVNSMHYFRAKFDDGMKLGINYCQPTKPITETPVVMTPALSTGLHGRNANIQRKLAELGLPSVLIGTPGGERDSLIEEIKEVVTSPKELMAKLGAICLSRNAHYVQEIIKQNDVFSLNNKSVIGYGESRGAMILLGNIAAQNTDDIEIPYSIAVAPCYPRPFKFNKSLEFTGQIVNEIMGLRQLIGSLSINHINTLNLSPKSIAYEIAHIPTLFNGDTGNFISEIPTDQNLNIISFKEDISGQPDYWQKAFPRHKYPNISTEILPGNHLSIAKTKTLNKVIDKFSLIAKRIIDNNGEILDLEEAI